MRSRAGKLSTDKVRFRRGAFLTGPSYSLDSDTEELMMKVIQETFDGCTIIAIAHRLETILGFDRIAVFDNGEIVEYDDPKTLLARNDSALSKLVAAGV